MRIPLTKYGLPQVAVFPAVLLTVILVVAWAMHKGIQSFSACPNLA